MTRSAEAAARMRAAFKSQGWGRNDVSVRSSNYSMGSSVTVSVKSARVDFAIAERVAESEEHVSRDQFGDILSGGNFFVFVNLDSDFREAMAQPWLEPIQNALANVPEDGSSQLFTVEGADAVWAAVGRQQGSWLGQLWCGSEMVSDFSPDCVTSAACVLAMRMQNAQ